MFFNGINRNEHITDIFFLFQTVGACEGDVEMRCYIVTAIHRERGGDGADEGGSVGGGGGGF